MANLFAARMGRGGAKEVCGANEARGTKEAC